MLGDGAHDLPPARLTVDPKNIRESLVAIRRGRDQRRPARKYSTARLPIERIAPAMTLESGAPRRFQYLQEVDRPLEVPTLAGDLMERGKSHRKMRVGNGKAHPGKVKATRPRRECLTGDHG